MFLSRNTLAALLVQPRIDDAKLQKALAEKFTYGSRIWRQLDKIELPPSLPPTLDPRLLALRRLVRRDLVELRAMHRLAVQRAADRRYGYLELQLEEVALLGNYGRELSGIQAPLPFVEDPAFRIFFSQLPKMVSTVNEPQLRDLRARAMAECARRLRLDGIPFDAETLTVALSFAEEGTGDVELGAFLAESAAISLAADGARGLSLAIDLRTRVVESLAEYPVVDRVAEAMVDLAELLRTVKRRAGQAKAFYEGAKQKISQLPAELNAPLRRRLASPASAE